MADPFGFLNVARADAVKRPAQERVGDWNEVFVEVPREELRKDVSEQASRCMGCGIPFCHSGSAGCPLGNLVPEWSDLARRGRWAAASERLHATNNFPEFTGRLCPAPCESACVLAISPESGGAVAIKRIEQTIADEAWRAGIVEPQPPTVRSGRSVAVVGSGPAGLAAAQQLTRAGHDVTVYERDDRIGGLLRYGIPEFKMEKSVLDQRLLQMRAEGTRFITDCEVGVDLTVEQLQVQHDAVVLALGALRGRDDHEVLGRHLQGVHLAMEHLVPSNHEQEGDGHTTITAKGKHVVIVGGGDTASDCLGTAHRQGAASVTQLDIYPEPAGERDDDRSPWPSWPVLLRSSAAHAEGGSRRFSVAVQEFLGDDQGHVRAMVLSEVQVSRDPDGRRVTTPVGEPVEMPCDLALLAIGFAGVQPMALLDELGLTLNGRGSLSCGPDWQTTVPGVFVCGDAHRGASLVVWAIAEGRSVAHSVDSFLTGASDLPSPVHPTALPLAVV